jgi:hypothetical protein
MNVSELITNLQKFLQENGDVPVVLYEYEDSKFYELDKIKLAHESYNSVDNEVVKVNPDKQPVCVLWS